MQLELTPGVERRKQVRLKVRTDLDVTEQRYEGRRHYVVKDPVSLRYYRFNEQEYFVVQMFNGRHTMEETQKEFEARYRPQRLTHEDLESFARQLLTAGLVHNESNRAAEELLESRKKQRRMQRLATLTNILYIKIPVIDPDRLLSYMYGWLWWIFTWPFFAASVSLMLAAVALVVTHYQTFYDKLPDYQKFFEFNTLLYMWISLGIVKVIHEFGHGLSCKAYGGECHEMGFLFMCLSPALYCNVSDSWTMANKWKRIIISFAGIYVELIIAAISTFVWWYTPGRPFVNNIALCLMTLCSISTFVFNANPLMRFDGYYILADWLEIPNLRDRCNRYLKNLFSEYCLGIEVQPEPYMAMNRRVLFVVYAIVSYIYRWVVTFSIIYTLSNFLGPRLKSFTMILALAALASMIGWPIYRLGKSLHQRGRLPDMKKNRVTATAVVAFILVLAFFLLPLPISRVRSRGVVELDPGTSEKLYPSTVKGAVLDEVLVDDGQQVHKGDKLMIFRSPELENQRATARAQKELHHREALGQLAKAQRASGAAERAQLEGQAGNEEASSEAAGKLEMVLNEQIERLTIRAPIDGTVFTQLKRTDAGKSWDENEMRPIGQVGDPKRLKVLLPVEPHEHQLLKEEMSAKGENEALPATVRIPGQGFHYWDGRVNRLPTADAKTVPVQLTFKGGGSLAIKTGDNPNVLVPQSQVYLVDVEILDVDNNLVIRPRPGVQPTVKIQCKWRSAAWWTWHKINNLFDLGMM